jgi:hypothetical protein
MILNSKRAALAVSMLALAGCCSMGGETLVDVQVPVTVLVSGTPGAYSYQYSTRTSGVLKNSRGDFDFSGPNARYHPIVLSFSIDKNSVGNAKFVSTPTGTSRDAMYIEKKVGEASPQYPYPEDGDQFAFYNIGNATQIMVRNRNDDGETYRYALRFVINGQPEADDPDVKNGGVNKR